MNPRPESRRCAIYTRKSSEEGLDQDFNSLHAQREACEAYIRSQQGEGWKLISFAYDDGGLSGGNMERPALQRLLADVALGKVDVVVVYKVDRLTRSLSDFSKMVEVFDRQSVSFVAVTQQFNTTTSMGRLTLNVLLSFAQFEREVTGERIRDKIAASKKKGMWMGGPVPLGYRVEARNLLVDPEEAETVREIFKSYLLLGTVSQLKHDLDRRGIRSKNRINRSGQPYGSMPFSRGALYALLSNPIYIGQVRHRQECHAGMQEGIVSKGTWDAVQNLLNSQAVRKGIPNRKTEACVLAGKLFDESGQTLAPSHAVKRGRRYRYYVSRSAGPTPSVPSAASAESIQTGWRLPAAEIEGVVLRTIRDLIKDHVRISEAAEAAGIAGRELPGILARVESAFDPLEYLERARLSDQGLEIRLMLPVPKGAASESLKISKLHPMRIKRRGVEMRMVLGTVDRNQRPVDEPLLRAMAQGRMWFERLVSGEAASATAIAIEEGVTDRWIGRLLPLAFLSPRIVKAALEGTQPAELTAKKLIYARPLPSDWREQERMFGFE